MRILVVVPRYGTGIVGGIETAARTMAERLAGRGHAVEVVTSCANDASTWADAEPPGTVAVGPVTVHRLPGAHVRVPETFDPLDGLVLAARRPLPLAVQEEWLAELGPQLPSLGRWLRQAAPRFDVVLVMPYLYPTTRTALATLAGRVPVVLFPAAHDEPAFRLTMYDTLLRLPDAIGFFTPEEQRLFERRVPGPPPGLVTGLGLDLPPPAPPADPEGPPALLVLGRVNPLKGVPELVRYVGAYRRRRTVPLELIVAGDEWRDRTVPDGVRPVGFVDERDKPALFRRARALVVPSYVESFSIVLAEGWLAGLPALVQGANEVLAGHVHRSGGGFAYRDYGEFEAAVDLLLERPGLGRVLGARGDRHVRGHYGWDTVCERIESVIALACGATPGKTRPSVPHR